MNQVPAPILLPRPRQFTVTGAPARARVADLSERVDPACGLPAQGYRLTIAPDTLTLVAPDAAGAFYGRMTLRQLERQTGATLPVGAIEDWPDFPSRGVMLDISRDKVPTLATLCALVDQLAEWKINHLELYTEHTFAYQNHAEVWQAASPLTAGEIRELDAYCRARFVELVPNQNSFGHFERWLKHARYRELAECPAGFPSPWGGHSQPTSLNPLEPRNTALLAELYAELLPNFRSRKFNVGCDETWELGLGRSAAACARVGKGRVYLDFLLKIHQLTRAHGRTMHFWGDIILQHPELVPELPKDVVVLEWGYEAGHAFAEHGALFARSGLPFYVCPGTSSWNTIAGRTDNALGNLRNAAVNGLAHGATGYLNTDWGDNGHWQPLPISYLGYAAGAAVAWCVAANQAFDDLPAALDAHVFRDSAGQLGRVACDLGNAYLRMECPIPNSSVLFQLLNQPPTAAIFEAVEPAKVAATRDWIAQTIAPLAAARPARPDGDLLKAEFAHAARMLTHACDRAARVEKMKLATDLRALIAEHERLWLARNRPGGLPDSAARLTARLADYA